MKKIDELENSMNRGPGKTFLELYGNHEDAKRQQAERYLGMIRKFRAFSRAQEAELFTSPGRTEIGGNHTDHNHGRVLAGAVNLDDAAVAAPNKANVIRIQSEGYPVFEVALSELQSSSGERFTSAALVRGICARMKELGYATGGFDACIDGRVPEGSGLSSSASFEVLIGVILGEFFNGGNLDPIQNAAVCQYAENHYFGKPCGLMDQTTCAMGGLIAIDFEDPAEPVVKKVHFDFASTGYALVIADTGGSHADLNAEYASIPADMKAVAAEMGAEVLRQVSMEQVLEITPKIRGKVGDRAVLRAIHFMSDNRRVAEQVTALERNDFQAFLGMVVDSGRSSFMYNQNVFPVHSYREQGISLALALSEHVLKGEGAWRVHGGGFAGTIQAFVPRHLLDRYVNTLEHVFGKGACRSLFIRQQGAGKLEI